MKNFDCGHRADRPFVAYCEDCLERICFERDTAQNRVRQLEAALSELAGEYRTLERSARVGKDAPTCAFWVGSSTGYPWRCTFAQGHAGWCSPAPADHFVGPAEKL